jgi:hypothetical protein
MFYLRELLSEGVSAVDRVARHIDVTSNFYVLRTDVLATFNEGCCDQCCEFVCGMLRATGRATSNIRSLSSLAPMLRLYCDHVATRVACNIQHQELSPLLLDTKPNIIRPQHRYSTSATLKINVCNTQQHVSPTSRLDIRNIENRCLQHPKI